MIFPGYSEPYWFNSTPEIEQKLCKAHTSKEYGTYEIKGASGVTLAQGTVSQRIYQGSTQPAVYDLSPTPTLYPDERLVINVA